MNLDGAGMREPINDTIEYGELTDPITLYIHYIRPDGNYDGWNLWVWGLGRIPCQCDFIQQDGHAVVKLILPGHKTQYISFIPRHSIPGNSWAQQEFGERRVELADLVCGTVHCYVDSGRFETSRVTQQDVVFANTPVQQHQTVLALLTLGTKCSSAAVGLGLAAVLLCWPMSIVITILFALSAIVFALSLWLYSLATQARAAKRMA